MAAGQYNLKPFIGVVASAIQPDNATYTSTVAKASGFSTEALTKKTKTFVSRRRHQHAISRRPPGLLNLLLP
jgi:hypothetical protein